MIRKYLTLDKKMALCWNIYTAMLTVKSPFSKKDLIPKAAKNVSVSQSSVGAGYQRLELLLVGFASVFITFLWVGVFSAVLQDRTLRVPFSGNGAVASLARNVADLASVSAQGMLDGGSMARDTIIYQFIAIWESSCITQKTCIGSMSVVSEKASTLVTIVDNIAANSSLFVTFAQDVSSFRIGEVGARLAQLALPTKVYASGVLGEKTIAPEVVLQKGIRGYYQHADQMTFGLVTVISPELTQESRQ